MQQVEVIRVGEAEIRRVEEMKVNSPIDVVVPDRAFVDAHRHWIEPLFLKPDGHFDLFFQSWIMQVDGRVFVIDPCNGNGRPHMWPMFDKLDTPYIERFEATGVRPEDVDYVFCTHLHHDHCGWSTRLRGDRYVPTFPKARYVYVRREFERWDTRRPDHQDVDYNVGVFERSVLPVLEAGLADLVNDHHRISPGVEIEPAYGHTLGHSMLHLQSQGHHACFTGDVFHHPLQMVDPRLHFFGCDDLGMAIETRRRVLDVCLARNALVIPAHFSAPHAGWIRQHDGAITFEPVDTRGSVA